jgi:hypothetical protein
VGILGAFESSSIFLIQNAQSMILDGAKFTSFTTDKTSIFSLTSKAITLKNITMTKVTQPLSHSNFFSMKDHLETITISDITISDPSISQFPTSSFIFDIQSESHVQVSVEKVTQDCACKYLISVDLD